MDDSEFQSLTWVERLSDIHGIHSAAWGILFQSLTWVERLSDHLWHLVAVLFGEFQSLTWVERLSDLHLCLHPVDLLLVSIPHLG